MKCKLLFGLLFFVSTIINAQVIFDPATYPVDSLPDGMTIVDIEGTAYLQVILDGWNSVVNVPEVTLGSDQQVSCEFKFALGDTSVTAGLALANINGVVQIMDTVNQIPNPWGDGTIPSNTGLAQSPVSGDLVDLSAAVSADMKLVHQVQFFGQETVSWGPTSYDTVWVGKIQAVTVSPYLIVDPAEFDTTALGDGASIVEMEGEKYFQVILNGWNSVIAIPEFTLTAEMTASCKFKFALGEASANAGLGLGNINGVVQLMDTINQIPNPWGDGTIPSNTGLAQSPVSGDLVDLSAAVSGDMQLVHQFQVFGQETTSWGPTTGDTVWVSKITLADNSAPADVENLAATVDGSVVSLSWDASSDNIGVSGYIISQDDTDIDTITGTTLDVTDLADGTYTFGVVAIDEAGNASAAATVDATVGPDALDTKVVDNLRVFPNPTRSELTIAGIADAQNIQIISMTGAVVVEVSDTQTVFVDNLEKGIYLIRVNTSNDIYSTTFVKE